MTPKAFHALFGRIGGRAKMPFAVHPHMLRHGCGYALANAGHDTRALQAWLGHKNIQHTVRYTELAPDRSRTCGANQAEKRDVEKGWELLTAKGGGAGVALFGRK